MSSSTPPTTRTETTAMLDSAAVAAQDLDSFTVGRQTDPETSHAAAASISTSSLRGSAMAVLRAFRERDLAGRVGSVDQKDRIRSSPGWIDEDLIGHFAALNPIYSESRLRTARKSLVRAGLLEATGRTRLTRRARSADVYDLTEAGRRFDLS